MLCLSETVKSYHLKIRNVIGEKMSGKVCIFRTLKQFNESKSTRVNGDVKIRVLSYFSSLESHFENYVHRL